MTDKIESPTEFMERRVGVDLWERMSTALDSLAAAAATIDTNKTATGKPQSQYVDYSEQDCLNATIIFMSVMTNWAIKNGHINIYNYEDCGNGMRDAILQYFGFDTIKEMDIEVKLQQSIQQAFDSRKRKK